MRPATWLCLVAAFCILNAAAATQIRLRDGGERVFVSTAAAEKDTITIVDHSADEDSEDGDQLSDDSSSEGSEDGAEPDSPVDEAPRSGADGDENNAEDLEAENRAEKLADAFGGIPEDYLASRVPDQPRSASEARAAEIQEHTGGRFNPNFAPPATPGAIPPLPNPRSVEFARTGSAGRSSLLGFQPAANTAPQAFAPLGVYGVPTQQQQAVPSQLPTPFGIIPESMPMMNAAGVPGLAAMTPAMSMGQPADAPYDVTDPIEQATFAFEEQARLAGDIPPVAVHAAQMPAMPSMFAAAQPSKLAPQVRFVNSQEPRFASASFASASPPQGPLARSLPRPSSLPQGPLARSLPRPSSPQDSFRFRSQQKIKLSKIDPSQTHITEKFLAGIAFARQQRAAMRRRAENRAAPGEFAPEREEAEVPERFQAGHSAPAVAQGELPAARRAPRRHNSIPPPPEANTMSLVEERASVRTHGRSSSQASSSVTTDEDTPAPPRRTRYDRLFSRPNPRARAGARRQSLVETDSSLDADMEAEDEVQGKPAGLPDEPAFEAPPPMAAAPSANYGGLRQEEYTPPHVVI